MPGAKASKGFAATYAHAAIGIAEIDENGCLLRVNETVCAITGYGRDELLGMVVFDMTHPDDRDRDRAHYAEQANGRGETATSSRSAWCARTGA